MLILFRPGTGYSMSVNFPTAAGDVAMVPVIHECRIRESEVKGSFLGHSVMHWRVHVLLLFLRLKL